MLKNIMAKKLVLVVLFGCLVAPQTSLGYWITDQWSLQISDNSVLFVTKYSFGLTDSAVRMPIGVIRSADEEKYNYSSKLNYTLQKADGEVYTKGATRAVIISSAKIIAGKYHVKQGTSRSFTLVSLLSLTDGTKIDPNKNLSLQIQHLPFDRFPAK